MLIIVNNQDKLFDLLYGQMVPSPAVVLIKEEFCLDESSATSSVQIQSEIRETEIVKEEPVFAYCEEEPLDDENEVVIAIEDSSDESEAPPPQLKKQIARLPPKPPKRKESEPESDRFCPYEDCQKLFTSKRSLRVHVESVHQKIKKFRCKLPNCGYESYQRTNVVTHQIQVHKLPNHHTYFCEQCGTQFP